MKFLFALLLIAFAVSVTAKPIDVRNSNSSDATYSLWVWHLPNGTSENQFNATYIKENGRPYKLPRFLWSKTAPLNVVNSTKVSWIKNENGTETVWTIPKENLTQAALTHPPTLEKRVKASDLTKITWMIFGDSSKRSLIQNATVEQNSTRSPTLAKRVKASDFTKITWMIFGDSSKRSIIRNSTVAQNSTRSSSLGRRLWRWQLRNSTHTKQNETHDHPHQHVPRFNPGPEYEAYNLEPLESTTASPEHSSKHSKPTTHNSHGGHRKSAKEHHPRHVEGKFKEWKHPVITKTMSATGLPPVPTSAHSNVPIPHSAASTAPVIADSIISSNLVDSASFATGTPVSTSSTSPVIKRNPYWPPEYGIGPQVNPEDTHFFEPPSDPQHRRDTNEVSRRWVHKGPICRAIYKDHEQKWQRLDAVDGHTEGELYIDHLSCYRGSHSHLNVTYTPTDANGHFREVDESRHKLHPRPNKRDSTTNETHEIEPRHTQVLNSGWNVTTFEDPCQPNTLRGRYQDYEAYVANWDGHIPANYVYANSTVQEDPNHAGLWQVEHNWYTLPVNGSVAAADHTYQGLHMISQTWRARLPANYSHSHTIGSGDKNDAQRWNIRTIWDGRECSILKHVAKIDKPQQVNPIKWSGPDVRTSIVAGPIEIKRWTGTIIGLFGVGDRNNVAPQPQQLYVEWNETFSDYDRLDVYRRHIPVFENHKNITVHKRDSTINETHEIGLHHGQVLNSGWNVTGHEVFCLHDYYGPWQDLRVHDSLHAHWEGLAPSNYTYAYSSVLEEPEHSGVWHVQHNWYKFPLNAAGAEPTLDDAHYTPHMITETWRGSLPSNYRYKLTLAEPLRHGGPHTWMIDIKWSRRCSDSNYTEVTVAPQHDNTSWSGPIVSSGPPTTPFRIRRLERSYACGVEVGGKSTISVASKHLYVEWGETSYEQPSDDVRDDDYTDIYRRHIPVSKKHKNLPEPIRIFDKRAAEGQVNETAPVNLTSRSYREETNITSRSVNTSSLVPRYINPGADADAPHLVDVHGSHNCNPDDVNIYRVRGFGCNNKCFELEHYGYSLWMEGTITQTPWAYLYPEGHCDGKPEKVSMGMIGTVKCAVNKQPQAWRSMRLFWDCP